MVAVLIMIAWLYDGHYYNCGMIVVLVVVIVVGVVVFIVVWLWLV